MAYVISAGTSLPRCHVDQKEAAVFAREMFKDSFKDIDRLLSAFQNGEIASRQFVMPLDWYKESRSFKEKIRRTLKWLSDTVQKPFRIACQTNGT